MIGWRGEDQPPLRCNSRTTARISMMQGNSFFDTRELDEFWCRVAPME